MNSAIRLAERGLVPNLLLRGGIRSLLRARLREQKRTYGADPEGAFRAWLNSMRQAPVALVPEQANRQHYEVPAAFFQLVLGRQLKYSSAFYPDAKATLDEAEECMLALTAKRAQLLDGQDVLELGCGWGSLTLWMARNFPRSRILAVSNSASQREFILAKAAEQGTPNVRVVTADMNVFTTEQTFDRVVSVEMFEHMRNWEALLRRVFSWVRSDGRLFLHVFSHKRYAYAFEDRDDSDWMSRYFFSGGMMPSHEMPLRLVTPFEPSESWFVPGTHYSRTAEDWLANLELHRAEVLELFRKTYSPGDAEIWFHRWRVFFLACAELFGFADGQEWGVSHHLLQPARVPVVKL